MDAKLNPSQVRKVYRRFASTYDLWSRLAESKARRRCLELADIKDGESILEVAVGTGMLFEQVLRANPRGRNEGVDLTEAMLARAKTRATKSGISNYTLRVGDAYGLEYADSSFDLVVNNYMFDLIPEKDFVAILTEFKRVLKAGGRVVLVNMSRGGTWFDSAWERLYERWPGLLGGCRGVEITPYVAEAGFERVRRELITQWMFPSEVVYAEKP